MAKKTKTTLTLTVPIAMIFINLSSSILNAVLYIFYLWQPPIRSSIWPMIVSFPMFKTIPIPSPSWHRVPKNTKFVVSKGSAGWEHSGDTKKGSVDPVKTYLSTFIWWLWIILISAGIFSPILTFTISPLTRFFAYIDIMLPSLSTLVY